MKTRVFEPGAICAVVALLVVFSLPAYAKNGGSSSANTSVSKTSSNATAVKPVTSSQKTRSGALQKSETVINQPKSNSKMSAADKTKKEVGAIKAKLSPVDTDIKKIKQGIDNKRNQETDAADKIKTQQDKSGSIQKNLDAATDKQRETSKTINCLVNC
jgi:chromosome segregation ATPase